MKLPTYNLTTPWTQGGWVKPTPMELEQIKRYAGFLKADYQELFGKAYLVQGTLTFSDWCTLLRVCNLQQPPFTDCPSTTRKALKHADIMARVRVRASTIENLMMTTASIPLAATGQDIQDKISLADEDITLPVTEVSVEQHVAENMTEIEKMEARQAKKEEVKVEEDLISDEELLSFF